MSNSQGGVVANATSITSSFELAKTSDSTPQTGKLAADVTLSYWRPGGVRVAVSASNLAAVNSVFSGGGIKEIDSANMPGLYRVDWPDAAFATGADFVEVAVICSGCFSYNERFPISALPSADDNANSVLDQASGIDTNQTVRQSLRLMLATLVGKASGFEGSTVTFRDTADTKNRIQATVDANGNRTAVTLDNS